MVSQLYGVLRPDGKSERAIFVIDKTGIIRYIDIHDIDDQPDNEVLFGVLEELEPEASAEYNKLMQKYQTDPLPDADVVIYCTPWCPDCRILREYLIDCSVPYQEIDISRNRAAARLVREWAAGKEVTPVIRVRNSDVIVEFDRPRLDAALEKLHVLP
jgi:glutaredoxin